MKEDGHLKSSLKMICIVERLGDHFSSVNKPMCFVRGLGMTDPNTRTPYPSPSIRHCVRVSLRLPTRESHDSDPYEGHDPHVSFRSFTKETSV